MDKADIADALQRVRRLVADAAESHGRDPAGIRLVAVSKTIASERIRDAYEAGQRVFGENRVGELETKAPSLPADVEWHMIGHLQSNKVKSAVALASLIHSVDSLKLLRRLDRLAGEAGKVQDILVQANVSGEESKHGPGLAEAEKLLAAAAAMANVRCLGLMTMAPYAATPALQQSVFSGLRVFRDDCRQRHGWALPELSMGMSGDFEAAIAAGATMLRLGSVIFGARQPGRDA